MSTPSSPSPSSGSDDFVALLDADLQKSSTDEDGVEQDDDMEKFEETITFEESEEETEIAEGLLVDFRDEDTTERKGAKDLHFVADSVAQIRNEKLARTQGNWQDDSRRGKRKREEDEDEAKSDSEVTKGGCPPHPGFMWGVCIRCGQNIDLGMHEPEPAAVALRYIHEGLVVTEREAARVRQDELKQVMLKQKFYLVLDLDHTLLNSARFVETHPEEEAYLITLYSQESQLGDGEPGFKNGLHRLNQLQMWTKIRPFAHDFIEAASKICELYVYTMGERAYALAMVRLLDPTGRVFGDRIISQADSTRSTTKDLDIVLGAESAVVILDDTEGVWPKHRANLILIERYHFFRSSCRQFGLRSASLTEKRRDESEQEGILAIALRTLRALHHTIFNAPIERRILNRANDQQDVRQVLQSMRRSILMGCRVVFSRVFPVGLARPEAHPFWQLTTELGAHCSTILDSTTTHIIAFDRGTDKAQWAKQHGKFLVHPSWVEAAQFLWLRPNEKDFPVGENNPQPPIMSFAKTVNVSIHPTAPDLTGTNGKPSEASLVDTGSTASTETNQGKKC